MSFNKYEYDKQYIKEHMKCISLVIPISEYESMKEHMEKIGCKKVNTYIRALITKDIENNGGISVGDITQTGDNNSINIG